MGPASCSEVMASLVVLYRLMLPAVELAKT